MELATNEIMCMYVSKPGHTIADSVKLRIPGLVGSNYNIEADYSAEKVPEEVYIETARRILEVDRDLYLLFDAHRRPSTPLLPSWVQDWSYDDLTPWMVRCDRMTYRRSSKDIAFLANGRVLTTGDVCLQKVKFAERQCQPHLPFGTTYCIEPNCYLPAHPEVYVGDDVWLRGGMPYPCVMCSDAVNFKIISVAFFTDSQKRQVAFPFDYDHGREGEIRIS